MFAAFSLVLFEAILLIMEGDVFVFVFVILDVGNK